MKSRYSFYPFVLFFLLCSISTFAQSPGIIVRPAGGNGVTPLNPDGNGYSSKATTGFATNDISESEILFKIVPPAVIEPTGDLATGPSGGFTDIVKTVDGSGFYIFKDATNIYFRLRIGGIISGSKGYSILIDTDGKMGNSGPSADPNYIAPTNTSNGNPGFEYEVVFRTNFEITVYNVDGTTSPVAVTPAYGLNTNSQISVALSTDGGNPDYFYDWFVPLSAIGNPASIRMVATTVTSPTSALQGSRSDIYGIDDAAHPNVASAWTTVANAQPSISLTNFSTYTSSIGSTCTAAPTLQSTINVGSNVTVTGNWTRMDASKPSTATITLYKNGVALSPTASVSSAGTWSVTVASVASGDVFYARAQATGESMCLESNNVTAGCATIISPSVLTQSSSKGICGSLTASATGALIYLIDGATSTLMNAGNANMTYTATTFTWFACSGGSGNLANGTYMIVLTGNGCNSAPAFTCITTGSSAVAALTSNAVSINGPVYPYQTTISGSGVASGNIVRLAVNDVFVSTITATATTFSFSGLSLKANDKLKVYVQAGTACLTVSSTFTVSCYLAPPVITTDASGKLLAGATTISGTSTAIGGTVTVFRGTSPSGVSVGTAVVTATGNWSVTTTALVLNENYYTTQTLSGCTSGASAPATVSGVTTVCPAFSPTSYASNVSAITGTISTTFAGVVKLYLDGVLIGTSATLTNPNTGTWSIPVNTTPSNILYPNGVLTANTEATGAAEKTNCNVSASVTCTAPTTPGINPSLSTINVGSTVTYTVSGANSDTWYAIQDDLGKSYATSVYKQDNNSFTITTNPITTAGTFDLKITADKLTGCAAAFTTAKITANHTALPVRFVDVNVKSNNNKPQVTWQVTDEQNVAYYSIERSYNGSFFEEGGKAAYKEATAVINAYMFTDHTLAAEEVVYYRIKQVDRDGKYVYSKIVSLKLAQPATVQLVPNPAYDRTEVQVVSHRQQNGWLQLVDPSGNVVKKQSVSLKKGTNKISLDGLQQFGNGTYFVQILLPDGTLYKKLLLQ